MITIDGVSKRYGSTTVLSGLSLHVDAGEIVGLLGVNGAGKTTTIRLLLGLTTPDDGTISIGEGSEPPRIGSLIEQPELYDWMSARRFLQSISLLDVPINSNGADHLLDRVGLLPHRAQRIKTFSQGMKQRLGLASALMGEPRILILDEPSNALDPAGIRDLREIVLEFANEGGTVLFSSHQMGEVERVADRIVILHEGKVVAEGTAGDLTTDASGVIVTTNEPILSVRQALAPHAVSQRTRTEVYVPNMSESEVGILLRDHGVPYSGVERWHQTLEDRFIELTQGAK